MILERLVGFAVIVVSGVSLVIMKTLELPGVLTIVLAVGASAIYLCGIVVLFAEVPIGFLRARKRTAVEHTRVSQAVVSRGNPDSVYPR